MNCQRCWGIEEAAYRVRSDLIDMQVCASCAEEARRLGISVGVFYAGETENRSQVS
jgi:hypothetical protein